MKRLLDGVVAIIALVVFGMSIRELHRIWTEEADR